MCFPRWHSPSIFSSLIGGLGGYSVSPQGRFVWGGFYEPGTLIWRSRWVGEESIIECREALALPADPSRGVLLRRVMAVSGTARLDIALSVRSDYGASAVRRLKDTEEGFWRGESGGVRALWIGGKDAKPVSDGHRGKTLTMKLEIPEGEQHDLALVMDVEEDPEPVDVEQLWNGTEGEWRKRIPPLDHLVGARDARHAHAVLSGLTASSGGLVAAATTSLPERARSGRSYDYRYVWIRDQCYAGQAAAAAETYPLLDSAVRFVGERLLADGHRLRPAYTVLGENVPKQQRLDLPGYPGGSDRIGNRVREQFQLDAFGEALLLLAAADEHDRLEAQSWRAAEIAAAAIRDRWREADAGVWETKPAKWVHSRLICAAGLRAIANRPRANGSAPEWLRLAEAIIAEVAAEGVHPSGRWQRAPDDERLDAALLLPAVRGAIPSQDPRALRTLQAVEEELNQDGYVYRFRQDARPLGEAEGAFLLCGFWLALAWHQQGDRWRAVRYFERTRAACGPPGLLSEEFDVRQRQLRGNLPQAFVHALLLEAASLDYEEAPESAR